MAYKNRTKKKLIEKEKPAKFIHSRVSGLVKCRIRMDIRAEFIPNAVDRLCLSSSSLQQQAKEENFFLK